MLLPCLKLRYRPATFSMERVRRVILREHHLAGLTLALLVGQYIGFLSVGWQCLAAGVSLILLVFYRYRPLTMALALVSGFAATMPLSSLPKLSSDETYLIEVIDAPRHPVPGLVMARVRVHGALHCSDERLHRTRCPLSRFQHPLEALLRGTDLPWRNASSLSSGTWQAVKAQWSIRVGPPRTEVVGRTLFISRPLQTTKGIFARLREHLTAAVRQVLGNNEKSGLLLALTLGKRDGLTRNTEAAFRALGLSHVLVVSGLHVGLLYAVLLLLSYSVIFLLYRNASRTIPITAALAGCWVFIFLVGAGPSSARAGIALTLFSASFVTGRKTSRLSLLLQTIFILHLVWPLCIFDRGVQYTLVALSTILFVTYRPWQFLQASRSGIYAAIQTSAFTAAMSLQLSLLFGQPISLLGVVANVLFTPIISFVGTAGGLLAIALLQLSEHVGALALVVVSTVLEHIASAVRSLLEGQHAGDPLQIAILIVVFLGIDLLLIGRIRKAYRGFLGEWGQA